MGSVTAERLRWRGRVHARDLIAWGAGVGTGVLALTGLGRERLARLRERVGRTIIGRGMERAGGWVQGHLTTPEQLHQTLTVERSVESAYAAWRGFVTTDWTGEIVEEQPHRRIAWHTVGHDGEVVFTPVGRGPKTKLDVTVAYRAPLGRAGELVARLRHEESKAHLLEELARARESLEREETAEPQELAVVKKRKRASKTINPDKAITADKRGEMRQGKTP